MNDETLDAGASLPVTLLTTVFALALVLVIAWFAIRMMARAGLGGAPRRGARVKVLQSVPLGARERLVLVRFDEREYLLGVSAGAVTTIERTAPVPNAAVDDRGSGPEIAGPS